MTTKKILIVDDDNQLLNELTLLLNKEQSLSIDVATSYTQGKDKAFSQKYDMFILDVALGDGNGNVLCKEIREAGIREPIIMLTAKSSDEDTINGLDAGANDYVAKPFRIHVLIARVMSHIQNYANMQNRVIAIRKYFFSPGKKEIIDKNTQKSIKLTEKEVSILTYLVESENQTASREQLLKQVWGYGNNINTHTLETHIYRLRQKIEDDTKNFSIIKRVEGGYQLSV